LKFWRDGRGVLVMALKMAREHPVYRALWLIAATIIKAVSFHQVAGEERCSENRVAEGLKEIRPLQEYEEWSQKLAKLLGVGRATQFTKHPNIKKSGVTSRRSWTS
jgi:hypothetical protein